jgi:amino acid adenylation domain-containing protein
LSLDRGTQASLRDGFLRSAMANPDRPALRVRGASLTYHEVEQRARVLAAALTEAAGSRPHRIGIFAYRSETAYIGTLAALFAGAAFVPLNRQFPAPRTRRMIERADLDALIVDSDSAAQLAAVLGQDHRVPLLLPEAGTRSAVHGARVIDHTVIGTTSPLAELPDSAPDSTAYLLFTSGTTGEPKGVEITHANVCHFIEVMSARYQLTASDRTSQTFDQTFDLSVFDIFMAWNASACLCVPQNKDLLAPARFVNAEALTVWFSVPSLVAYMRKMNQLTPGAMPTLRWSLFCGEALPRRAAEEWQAAAPASTLENLYGPTELTIACCVYRWGPGSADECVNDVVLIGRPLPGLEATVVDDDLRPLSQGETGELCVAGPQTSPGYWRDAEKTAERFVRIQQRGSRRFYRTGDLVTQLPSGDYAYLGRRDSQVKIRGYRVELGEIESVLLRHARVHSAAVVARPGADGQIEALIAFVTGDKPGVAELKAHATTLLPTYMLPREFVVLDAFPLNANGKVDRAALLASLPNEIATAQS